MSSPTARSPATGCAWYERARSPWSGRFVRLQRRGPSSGPLLREEDQGATLTRFTADTASGLGGPTWLQARRRGAYERFDAADLPTTAEEVWRYSRIDDLDLDDFAPATGAAPDAAMGPSATAIVEAVGARAGLIVVRNGAVVEVELDPLVAAKGVRAGVSDTEADGDLLGSVANRSDAFIELHDAFMLGAVVIDVPAGVAVADPIVIVHVFDGDGTASFPRTVVRAGEASQVTVVEHLSYSGGGGASFVAPIVELDAGPAANLRYCNVQELDRSAWQVAYQASRVAKAATLQSTTIALGGGYARVRTDSHLVGEGGTSNLLAVYFGDSEQMHDFRTMQDHDAPKTTSDLLFKGAVSGVAHAVYTGLIRVARGAAGTNAFQTNRNLVLSEGARADSVPNLEIEENDVKCSHASAVGPIDEEQRYYLESRGIPTEAAERLIVLGFFDDVLARAPVPGLRVPLRSVVAAKLDAGDR